MTDCLYCSEPIEEGQELVRGVEAVAHSACVVKKLDRLNPNWRKLVDHPKGRDPKRNEPRGTYRKQAKRSGRTK